MFVNILFRIYLNILTYKIMIGHIKNNNKSEKEE